MLLGHGGSLAAHWLPAGCTLGDAGKAGEAAKCVVRCPGTRTVKRGLRPDTSMLPDCKHEEMVDRQR